MSACVGPGSVQLRFETKLTFEQYLTERAWTKASLLRCPLHPAGGCGVAAHGTYLRKHPEPTPVARFYCAKGHTTISLLPDFFASRLPGTLDAIEQVAAVVEDAASVEKAAEELRPAEVDDAITLAAAVRWTARRVALVAAILVAIVGLFPERLAGVRTLGQLRQRLGTTHALVELREIAAAFLAALPPPLGFGPRSRPRRRRTGAIQHDPGQEPPAQGGYLVTRAPPRGPDRGDANDR